VHIDRPAVKQKAKEIMRQATPKPILVGLIYLLVVVVISALSSNLVNLNLTEDVMQTFDAYVTNGKFEQALVYLSSFAPSNSAMLIHLLLQAVLRIVQAGLIIFILNTIRNTGACFGNLLDGFGKIWRVLLLNLLIGLFVFLWSLLFIIPGIIASYRYRMAIYLLLDHPEMSVMECIRTSKRMMAGHKGELFAFDWSFFGWMLLESLPVVGYGVMVYTTPYREMSYGLYYESLCGRDIYAKREIEDNNE